MSSIAGCVLYTTQPVRIDAPIYKGLVVRALKSRICQIHTSSGCTHLFKIHSESEEYFQIYPYWATNGNAMVGRVTFWTLICFVIRSVQRI